MPNDPSHEKLHDLNALLARVPVPLTLADLDAPDVPVVAANDAFYELTGFDADAVLGRNCRFLQDDLDNTEARTEIRLALSEGRRGQVILKNRHRDGHEFFNFLTIQPVNEPNIDERLVLGAQFVLTKEEAFSALAADDMATDTTITQHLSRLRNIAFERRRLMISAASRMVQSAMIMRTIG